MVLKENRVGVNMNDALLNMANRVPSADLFMIINSVVTLSQQGGDLSEAFETIAATIRERQRIHEKIRTLAQAGLTQATILSALPFVMMAVLNIVQPTYVSLLFGTPLGWFFVGLIFVFILAGILWMRKILTIEI
jgi:tight adherence protein B